MPRQTPKVVFDCNILWQAFFSANGAAARCRELLEAGAVRLFLSREVLDEVRDVLTRPYTQARFATATDEAVATYINNLARKSVVLRSVPKVFSYPRDPDDEPYINLAVAAQADYIVTRDKDLLDLMTGHTDDAKEFRQRFRPLKVVDPVVFLREIEKASNENN